MRKFKGFSTVNRQHTDWRLYDIDLAKQDLLNEIYTRKGERLMSPSFGYVVWDLLFDPLTEHVTTAIEQDTIRIVSKDPRFQLLQILVTDSPDESSIDVNLRLYYVPSASETELMASFSRNLSDQRIKE
jgi:phage baseplate assembly protein W